jgi:hypothetical protein
VIRRLMPGALLLALSTAACSSQAPGLTDPTEIITQGLEATSEVTSFQLSVAVTGSLTIPDTGGTFDLQGTEASGAFDIANQRGRMTFEVPGFLGLNGEVIQVGGDSYLKTSVTGPDYTKSSIDDGGVPMDPGAALEQVRSFLDEEGVEAEKLDDVSCGDRTCYAVRLTIPTSLLAAAGEAADVDPGQFLGEELVLNLQFDRETLQATQISTDLDAGEIGTFGLVIRLSNYNEAVEVSPPPSDQVTEGDLPF